MAALISQICRNCFLKFNTIRYGLLNRPLIANDIELILFTAHSTLRNQFPSY